VTSWRERAGRDGVPDPAGDAATTAERNRQRQARFTELYRANYPFVLRFALRRLRALDAAQDATVATFAVVWSRFEDVPEVPRAWIYRIARSVVSLELRQRIRDERAPGAARASRLRLAEHELEDDPVLRALSELQDDDREVLQLRAWEDLTGAEIGEVLGCSPNDVAVRLHAAQQRLRELLNAPVRSEAEPGQVAASPVRPPRRPAARAVPRPDDTLTGKVPG
jgi:RNA polymerase sigma-70 factor (ECF subfamily)